MVVGVVGWLVELVCSLFAELVFTSPVEVVSSLLVTNVAAVSDSSFLDDVDTLVVAASTVEDVG